MTSKVCPIEECEICFEEVPVSELGNYKCWKENSKHMICNECVNKENKRRRENRINTPNECILCKPFQERKQNITININNNVNNIIRDMARNQQRQNNTSSVHDFKKELCIISSFMVFYWIMGIILWNFFVFILNYSLVI